MPTKVKARSAAAAVAGKNGHSLISDEKFRQLYATMLRYRLLEERLSPGSADSPDGAQSHVAGTVGVSLNLEPEDTVVLTPRSLLASFVKSAPNGTGHRAAFGNSAVSVLLPPSPTVCAQLAFATGAALANKLAKNHKIAVAFVEGDAAALAGCREALELASAQKLPVLYVVEKYLAAKRQRVDLLAEIGELFPVITVDAHDVVAVYRVAQESIARTREGGGPSLIACMPYALNGATPNAVANMERYLAGKNLLRDEWKDEVIVEFGRELDAIS